MLVATRGGYRPTSVTRFELAENAACPSLQPTCYGWLRRPATAGFASLRRRLSSNVRRHRTMRIEQRLQELGLVLPLPVKVPPGLEIPFAWVRLHGDRAYVSGHGPLNPDGSPAGPFGRVGAEVSQNERTLRLGSRLCRYLRASSVRSAISIVSRRGCSSLAW